MRNKTKMTTFIFIPFFVLLFLTNTFAQKHVGQQRFTIRELGIPFSTAIPDDENAITSLTVTPDGTVYGATSGLASHLFKFSPGSGQVMPLGKISGAEGVYHALVTDNAGKVYVGTGKNLLANHSIPREPLPGYRGVIKAQWKSVEDLYRHYEGGHLFMYDPKGKETRRVMSGDECPVTDLGIPVPGDGVQALTIDKTAKKIYGISYPHARFFVYDMEKEKFRDAGQISKYHWFVEEDNRSRRSICRALICDDKGNVYGSTEAATQHLDEYLVQDPAVYKAPILPGFLFRYNTETEKIEILRDAVLPGQYYSFVETFSLDAKGRIYGGTSEGYLFRFDPVTEKLDNLGKPWVPLRIRALSTGKDGKIYGMAGEKVYGCRLFSYDPQRGAYNDLGAISVNNPPYYQWKLVQADAMVTGLEGSIYIGESERKAHLFIFNP